MFFKNMTNGIVHRLILQQTHMQRSSENLSFSMKSFELAGLVRLGNQLNIQDTKIYDLRSCTSYVHQLIWQ